MSASPPSMGKLGQRLMVWGRNSRKSILGIGEKEKYGAYPIPRYVNGIKTPASSTPGLQWVAAGSHHCGAVAGDGSVWTWGTGGGMGLKDQKVAHVPTKVAMPEMPATDGVPARIEVGQHHTAVLTTGGALYTFGDVKSFQYSGALGTPKDKTANGNAPRRVQIGGSEDIRVTQVKCGHLHTAAVGLDGELWTWGSGGNGALGDGSAASDRYEPRPVSMFQDMNVDIESVACGQQFTLALGTNGVLYSFGQNTKGQLGHGHGFHFSMEPYPRPIEALANKNDKVVHIAAGAFHSACLTESGQVYVWGGAMWPAPQNITKLFNGAKIVQLSCGHLQTVALSDKGEVFVWGKGFFQAVHGILGPDAMGLPLVRRVRGHEPISLDAFKPNNPVGAGAVSQVASGHWLNLAVVGGSPPAATPFPSA